MVIDLYPRPIDASAVNLGHQLFILLPQTLIARILTGVHLSINGGRAMTAAAADDLPESGRGGGGG